MLAQPKRILSLLPSATEIVCALGCEKFLVGRSHECDFPKWVEELPVCTEAQFDCSGSSRAIDKNVKSLVQNGLSLYKVPPERLRAARPDVIITQLQCELCAVTPAQVEAATAATLTQPPKIVSLVAQDLSGVWTDIKRVAQALGVPDEGPALVDTLKRRIAGIEERTRAIRDRPRVACLEWLDPLMAAGNWVPELIELAGGTNLFGEAGRHSPWLEWADLRQSDPDVILLLPCGFNRARTRTEAAILVAQPDWAALRAVRGNQVYVLDGHQYFNRPGPRLVDSLEIVAEILHPEIFSFGHRGQAWELL